MPFSVKQLLIFNYKAYIINMEKGLFWRVCVVLFWQEAQEDVWTEKGNQEAGL